jgi:hypothetical protein
MRTSILLRPSILFFTVSVIIFVTAMVAIAANPSSGKEKCTPDHSTCTGGDKNPGTGTGGAGGRTTTDESTFTASGGGGQGKGFEVTGDPEHGGGHHSLTTDSEGNFTGALSGGGADPDEGAYGGRCIYDGSSNDPVDCTKNLPLDQ